ncbi:MAG: MFS transporter [Bacteroidales bacterium]|nr:MFS transporter [Bacteroidales bacterium]
MKNSGKVGKRSGLKDIFRSLQYRNFRLFFFGQGVSLIGTWMQRIALPWLVYDMTKDPVMLGLVSFAGQAPTFLLAPFAGVVSDRWNKYRVIIGTQALFTLQALVMTILYFGGNIRIWEIVILSIFLGAINAFDMPTRQAFMIHMVDRREDLANAIALNSSMVNLARLIGPLVAGVLIAVTNEGVCFLVNTISYLFVIVSLLMMVIQPITQKVQNQHVLKGLKEGFNYAFGYPPLRAIILLLALVSLVGMPYTVLMPIFAKSVLHGDSHTFGFLMGAAGVGALGGALYLASRKSVLKLERLIPVSVAIFGAGLIAFSISRIEVVSIALMLFVGFGMIMQMAASNTIIQTLVDDDKRGRVMSIYLMAFVGTVPFGSLIAGALAKSIGAPSTLMIGGVISIIGASVFAKNLKKLSSHMNPVYAKLGIIPEVASGLQNASDIVGSPGR